MKRVLSLVLALSMVMSMFTFSFAGTSLKDVAGTEYESAVEALVELGIVNGYKDGTYLPENVVSRSEMAKLLVVAAGLAPAAELAEGTTKFSDVAADHWATGYINVAAEYGYVMGDPDGSFRPDDTVSYAEAITMALRVLGYKTVIEAKGTWPTNYIAKAEELDLLEDITYGTYATGAARGNVALLIWNMLRTKMWNIDSESEGDGLTYRQKATMLETKFKDYTYAKVLFGDFEITDGEIFVTLNDSASETKLEKVDNKYEYAEADFFKFVPGAEVEVLVNEKDETLLSITPSGADKLVEGTIATLTDEDGLDYEFTSTPDEKYDYAYGILGKNKTIKSGARLLEIVSSEYVYEIDEKENKWVKLNETRFKYDTAADTNMIFVKDGALATFEDVEEGDVITKVSCDTNKDFYVVANEKVSGKLEAYDRNGGKIEIADEKYDIIETATYVIDTTDEDESQKAKLKDADAYYSDMKNEVVDAYVDFFGTVVRVEFDGELGDDNEDETTFGFFAVKSWVEKSSARKYDVVLENEDGEDTYVFADDSRSVATGIMTYQEEHDIRNTYAYVKLNSDGEIVAMKEFKKATEEDLKGEKVDEKTVRESFVGAKYDEDKAKFIEDRKATVKVDDSTTIVTLVHDDEDNKYTDVRFDNDVAVLKNLGDEDTVYVIYEEDSKTITPVAKYVVLSDEVNARENDLIALVVEKNADDVYGNTLVVETEDGEKITYKNVDNDIFNAISKDNIIRYEIETDEEDDKVTVKAAEEIVNRDTYKWAAVVELVNGKEAKLKVTLPAEKTFVIDMADEDTLEEYEDYRILSVKYDYDEVEDTYEIESFEEISIDDVDFAKDDLFFDYAVKTPGDKLMIILSK